MKRAACLSMLILLAGTAAYAADEVKWRRDVPEAVAQAKADGKLLLVFITGPAT